MRYYHGGVPGLRAGDRLLPPEVSGTERTLSEYVPSVAPHGHRRDVVYVTPDREAARTFAAFYPDGALYEVELVGAPQDDPDAPGVAAMVRAATVRTVVDAVVLFRSRPPEKWLRALTREPDCRQVEAGGQR